MGTWELIKALVKNSGFYKKQFIFFVSLFFIILSLIGYRIYSNYLSGDPMSPSSSSPTGNPQKIRINVTKDGRIFRDGKVVSMVELKEDYEIIRYKVLDKPGVYIDNLTVEVNVEPPYDPYSIEHYVIPEDTDSGYMKNTQSGTIDHGIAYTGQYLGPQTVFTVYARFPKNTFSVPWWRSSAIDITTLPIVTWIIIGLSLPFLTFLILCVMLLKRWFYNRVSAGGLATDPPDIAIQPAAVGVLMHGRIGPREIAATLIDLAQRGYIHIFEDQDNFSFGRGHALESEEIYNLNNYEKLLLSKIFEHSVATNNLKDINNKLNQSLFSRKIAEVYLEIYSVVAEKGYFEQNPGVTHQKYKLSGMFLFLVSSIGFIFNILFNKSFPFLIFFWVGMMASSTLIIYFAPRMPILTPKGKAARQAWLNFRNYLIKNKTINFKEVSQSPYTKYLPYAIALDAEVGWTQHFYDIPFARPMWFDSDPSVLTIEDFANTLFPLIAYISNNLIVSRTPVVD